MFRSNRRKAVQEVPIELENVACTQLQNQEKNQMEPSTSEKVTNVAQESLSRAEQDRVNLENHAKLAILKTDSEVQMEIIKANAKIVVARKEAEAIQMKARAEVHAKKIVGAAEIEFLKKKMQIELEYLTKLSELLQKNPALLQIELAKINSGSKDTTEQFSREKYIGGFSKPGSATFFQQHSPSPKSKTPSIHNDSQPDVVLHQAPSPIKK